MAIKILSHQRHYSTPPVPASRLTYQARITRGHKFENDLTSHLAEYGIVTTPFGRALLSLEFQSELAYLNDPTSRFLRYLPDLAGRLPNRGSSFLIEAKSTLTATMNYSLNLTSYDIQRNLVLNSNPPNSLNILYIFPPPYKNEDYRAEWVQNLHKVIFRQVRKPEILRTTKGSQLPFALLSKDKLRPLTEILNELIKSAPDVPGVVKKTFIKGEYENKLYGIKL